MLILLTSALDIMSMLRVRSTSAHRLRGGCSERIHRFSREYLEQRGFGKFERNVLVSPLGCNVQLLLQNLSITYYLSIYQS